MGNPSKSPNNIQASADSEDRGRGINRRQMVQRLVGSMGGAAAFTAVTQASPLHAQARAASAPERENVAEWSPQFLDPHQNETLVALAERIIPGCGKAQVNRTIDLLLSVDSAENQRKFIASLSAFEAASLDRYQQPFVTLTEEQQVAILTDASATKPAKENSSQASPSDAHASSGESPPVSLRDHFENLKDWVSETYYSSEVGMKELGWTGQVYFSSFPTCQHSDGH
jgi:Gluconate 2-dehydrogenase subunit 3